jgi:hypothetical protein
MWGDVLTRLLVVESLAERTRTTGGQARRERACGYANSLTLSGFPGQIS